MDAQDIINIGREAKRETEDFINSNIHDGTKGWPRLCVCGSSYDELCRRLTVERRDSSYCGGRN